MAFLLNSYLHLGSNVSKLFRIHGATFARRNASTSWSFRPRRSLLYVPGHDERKIAKINSSLNVDCAILDCEDGVALNRKATARDVISRTMADLKKRNPRTEIGVRINAVSTGMAEDDLEAIFSQSDDNRTPDVIVFPKVEDTSQVDWLVDRLLKFRKSTNRNTVRLVVLIESARSLLDMDLICSRFKERSRDSFLKLDAAIFGSDDFCANIGATRTADTMEVLYARQHFVVVAKAHRLQAIDMVDINYKALENLKEQCIRGAQMGFTGKQVIHPDQVPVVQAAFMPSEERIKWASELIETFEEHQKSGQGAFTFHGSMIDMPSLRQAQNVIQLMKYISNQ